MLRTILKTRGIKVITVLPQGGAWWPRAVKCLVLNHVSSNDLNIFIHICTSMLRMLQEDFSTEALSSLRHLCSGKDTSYGQGDTDLVPQLLLKPFRRCPLTTLPLVFTRMLHPGGM